MHHENLLSFRSNQVSQVQKKKALSSSKDSNTIILRLFQEIGDLKRTLQSQKSAKKHKFSLKNKANCKKDQQTLNSSIDRIKSLKKRSSSKNKYKSVSIELTNNTKGDLFVNITPSKPKRHSMSMHSKAEKSPESKKRIKRQTVANKRKMMQKCEPQESFFGRKGSNLNDYTVQNLPKIQIQTLQRWNKELKAQNIALERRLRREKKNRKRAFEQGNQIQKLNKKKDENQFCEQNNFGKDIQEPGYRLTFNPMDEMKRQITKEVQIDSYGELYVEYVESSKNSSMRSSRLNQLDLKHPNKKSNQSLLLLDLEESLEEDFWNKAKLMQSDDNVLKNRNRQQNCPQLQQTVGPSLNKRRGVARKKSSFKDKENAPEQTLPKRKTILSANPQNQNHQSLEISEFLTSQKQVRVSHKTPQKNVGKTDVVGCDCQLRDCQVHLDGNAIGTPQRLKLEQQIEFLQRMYDEKCQNYRYSHKSISSEEKIAIRQQMSEISHQIKMIRGRICSSNNSYYATSQYHSVNGSPAILKSISRLK